jgi:hypothetical protein
MPGKYFGEDKGSRFYWGDLCNEHIRYIRIFRTLKLDVLSCNPSMPYHDPKCPGVKFWYSASAQDRFLLDRINPVRLDRIAARDGMIMFYAHTARFVDDPNAEDPELIDSAKKVFDLIGSRKDVWCAGVESILDRLLVVKNLNVTERPNAVVVSNPLNMEICDLQLQTRGQELFTSDGKPMATGRGGVVVIDRLRPMSSVTLYRSRSGAEIQDTTQIGQFEKVRMMAEEAFRLVWQKLMVLLGHDVL